MREIANIVLFIILISALASTVLATVFGLIDMVADKIKAKKNTDL